MSENKKLTFEEAISGPKHDLMEKKVSPPHYKGKTMEVIDVIDAFDLDLYQGSIVQYVIRYKQKEGLVCLKKAKWYLDRMITKIEKETKEQPPF